MPTWTKEQQDAIDRENTNIIVSAGAGSGKTAVLSERVLRKLKNGVNVDELLIMTFTRAAANEMKERIRKKIKKDESLKKQLDLIDAAYITTFDSFALSIVKKYHYMVNISRDINIIDNNVIAIKKEEILDEIFDEMYAKKDENFINLIKDFCIKDDEDIKKQILVINNKLDMKTDKLEYLEHYIDNMFNDLKIEEDINSYVILLRKKIDELHLDIEDISNYVDSDYMQKLEITLSGLFSAFTYNDIKVNSLIKLPSLPKGMADNVKELKNGLSKKIKAINNMCRYDDIDYLKNSVKLTKKYVQAIIDIILLLDKRIYDYKSKLDVYEFNDIAK